MAFVQFDKQPENLCNSMVRKFDLSTEELDAFSEDDVKADLHVYST